MGERLKGRVAIVTGSGRGVGRCIAIALAQEGAKVVVNDPGVNVDGTGFDQGPADQVVQEIRSLGGEAVPNYEAVGTMQAGESLVRTALDNFGRIDILVNCAGILRDRMIFNMTEEEWDAVIQVHLKGTFACTRAVAPIFRQQRYGRIVNITSGALLGNSGQANYAAAKGGIIGFTRVVARDLGRYGVTCNAVGPMADTRMTATIPDISRLTGMLSAGGVIQSFAGIAAAGRLLAHIVPREPENVAPIVVYLCTDAAWNINGQVFIVAGGGMIGLSCPETPINTISKGDKWTLEELSVLVPTVLMADIPNPAPPPPDLEIPGRTKAG